MQILYCTHCNRFFFTKRIMNFCRGCRKPLLDVPMKLEEFTELSANNRYRLAYRLTNEYEQLLDEMKSRAD